MNLIRGVVGLILMTLGRKLFTLFVAGFGFLIGLDFAQQVFPGGMEWLVFGIALAAALVTALLARFVQKVAIGLAGFLGGGYALAALVGLVGFNVGSLTWVLFLFGGIIGVILAYTLLNWALIIFSSLVGAVLVAETLPIPQAYRLVAFVFLAVLGIVIQARMLKKD